MRIGAGIAIAVILLSARVQAQPPPSPTASPPAWKLGRIDLRRVAGIALVYTRGPGTERLCSDEAEFRNAVAVSFDGFDAFEPARADEATFPLPLKRLEVSIVRRKAEVTVTMSWFGEGKSFLYRREYTEPATECDRLFRDMVSSAAISITVAIPPLPDLTPSPVSAPSSAPAALVRAETPPVPAAASRPLFRIGAAPLLAFEITPGFAAGAALDAAVRWPSVSLGLEGRILLASTDAPGLEAAIRTTLGAVAAVPCLHLSWFFSCGLFEIGAMRFTGGDNVHPETRDPFVAAGGLRAGVEWAFSEHFAARGFVDGSCVFTRTTLVYDKRKVWETPPVFGGLGVGLTAAF